MHFAHGPHFKDSKLSTSEHELSHGLSQRVKLSACHVSGLYDIQ